jgi:tRNA U34 5-carboxymethylaminomethyl modifying GTPase MnmE/TrmE
VRHADYRDRGGAVVDDVLATFFAAPHSYTGEDALEFSCHGNPFIAHKILGDLLARGCRPAEPGEFTQRAFLNGRMDLSQAEAVMDLIQARGERALAAARQQLRGALSRRMAELRMGCCTHWRASRLTLISPRRICRQRTAIRLAPPWHRCSRARTAFSPPTATAGCCATASRP